jgi:type I restriction-modification system DNA methylase subunit
MGNGGRASCQLPPEGGGVLDTGPRTDLPEVCRQPVHPGGNRVGGYQHRSAADRKANFQARGVLYLPEQSRFANLLHLKEGDNLGKAINDAMAAIEEENPALKGVLPRTYQSLSNDTLVSLLRSVNAILGEIGGDAFGKVYEYFLGKFAVAEGAKGGEYFTPTSIVRLIVEIT